MTVDLHFQGPNQGSENPEAPTLLELLADAAKTSVGGIAIFSFASPGGLRLLLGDPDISQFLQEREFSLVVGIDAVTTPEALEMLAEAADSNTKLHAWAFLHHRRAALFHPKVSWFCAGRTGRCIAGSGNLTRGGLLNNWEAFIDAKVGANDARRMTSRWRQWLEENKEHLHHPADSDVLARARLNQRPRKQHEEGTVEIEDDRPAVLGLDQNVLVAEIPRASDRWNQANFDKSTYMTFFGLKPGTSRRVVLYPVRQDGTVGNPEIRPGVSVKSQNYRIELGEAVGSYPIGGRPVGVFLRTGVRRFRYRLLMPADDDYRKIKAVLRERSPDPERPNRVRRVALSYGEFSDAAGLDMVV